MRRETNPLAGVIEATLSVGSRLDNYRIEEQIGWGNVAQVYRATDTQSDTTVALKLLQPRYASDLEVAARLAREATAVSRIDNPHVVRITRLAECKRGPYVVMEFIEGIALDKVLAKDRLSTTRLLRIALEICSALGAAHDQGVIHRDLKPENILLTEVNGASSVKLIDFGVAKVSFDAIHVASTRPGTIVGSPGYMAPEQIRSLPIDARTDIYALGVLLYEMLGGRRPFEGELLQEVLAGHVMQPPPPLHRDDRPVDARLEALVFRCLAKAPADRPSTMNEIAEELHTIADEIAPEALVLPPTIPETPELPATMNIVPKSPRPRQAPTEPRPSTAPDTTQPTIPSESGRRIIYVVIAAFVTGALIVGLSC